VNQITESYKDHEASRREDSFEKVCEGIYTVRYYIENRNEIFADPAFKQATKTFDITVMPITCMKIIAALVEYPLAGVHWNGTCLINSYNNPPC